MTTRNRPPDDSLIPCFEAFSESHSAKEVAQILGINQETVRRYVRFLIKDDLVMVVGTRKTSIRTSEQLFRKVPGARWPEPLVPGEFVLPDAFMFRMVTVRPGAIHA